MKAAPAAPSWLPLPGRPEDWGRWAPALETAVALAPELAPDVLRAVPDGAKGRPYEEVLVRLGGLAGRVRAEDEAAEALHGVRAEALQVARRYATRLEWKRLLRVAEASPWLAADPPVRAALLRALGDAKKSVRGVAVRALAGQANDPAVRDALVRSLADKDADVRWAAVEALGGQSQDPTVRAALLRTLDDTNALVRWSAAGALAGQADDPVVHEALVRALRGAEWFVRRDVAREEASQAREAVFLDILFRGLLITDKDEHVRSEVVRAPGNVASLPEESAFRRKLYRLKGEGVTDARRRMLVFAGAPVWQEIAREIAALTDAALRRELAAELLAGMGEAGTGHVLRALISLLPALSAEFPFLDDLRHREISEADMTPQELETHWHSWILARTRTLQQR